MFVESGPHSMLILVSAVSTTSGTHEVATILKSMTSSVDMSIPIVLQLVKVMQVDMSTPAGG